MVLHAVFILWVNCTPSHAPTLDVGALVVCDGLERRGNRVEEEREWGMRGSMGERHDHKKRREHVCTGVKMLESANPFP
jgi:hypothetical protein